MSFYQVQRLDKIAANLDINLDNCIITYKTVTRLLLSIIEFLSYNRNQIPLVYETFNHLVKNLENCSKNKSDECLIDVKDFAIERQRELAVRTNRKFQEISEILINSFKQCEMEQAAIVFGATIFTAKEAFVINLPSIAKHHLPENHLDSLQTITRKVIMSIISSTKFFDVNCNELKPTNMYVFLKPRNSSDLQNNTEQFHRHDNFQLPINCRTTVLNIKSNINNASANCCRNLFVFHDFKQLNIELSHGIDVTQLANEHDEEIGTDTNKDSGNVRTNNALDTGEQVPNLEKNYSNHMKNKDATTNEEITINSFYECNVSVKGFKDQLIKGKSIWIN